MLRSRMEEATVLGAEEPKEELATPVEVPEEEESAGDEGRGEGGRGRAMARS